MARVRALLRRLTTGHASAVLTLGDVTARHAQFARASGAACPLICRPWNTGCCITSCITQGRAVSQIELTEHIYAQDFERDSNAIEVLVARLRRKTGRRVHQDPARLRLLRGRTERGGKP